MSSPRARLSLSVRRRRIFGLASLLGLALLVAPASAPGSVAKTFSNASPITIPSSGNATPYPSSIAATGLVGSVQTATVTLRGYSHSCPHDVAALLVAPDGARSILMADIGPGLGCPDSTDANLTFDDAATAGVPYPPVTGTYNPTDGESADADPFAVPAPSPPYPVALSSFAGVAPTGTWSLYVQDQAVGDSGSIAQGWRLTLMSPSSKACNQAKAALKRAKKALSNAKSALNRAKQTGNKVAKARNRVQRARTRVGNARHRVKGACG